MDGTAVLGTLLGHRIGRQQLVQESGLTFSDEPPAPFAGAEAEQTVGPAASDAELAAACRRGNLAAYEQLYATHGARMKSFARNLLGNAHDAEDVVQEVFLKVHRSIASFRGQSAFSTWVYRILVNSCYDLRRKKMRRQETPEQELVPEGGWNPPAPAPDHPLRMALEQSVAQLTDDQRKVFVMFEVEGFSHAEIAGMLGISEAASKNRLYQAKVNLRRWLKQSAAPRES